jgi:ABC-type uncharacterized transport system substrate-binding protein
MLLLGAILSSGVAMAQGRSLLVLVSQDNPRYRAVYEALHKELQAAQAAVELTSRYLDSVDAVELSTLSADMVVSIGSAAMETAAALYPSKPKLVLFVPQARFIHRFPESLLQPPQKSDSIPGAVVLDHPISRQIQLAHHLLPQGKLGLLLGPNTRAMADAAQKANPHPADSIIVEHVDHSADIVPAAQALLEKSDALIAVPDTLVWSPESAKWLLYLAYKHRKPVIGFSAALTRAGAVASLYSEPGQIGKQGGEKILQWLQADERWRELSPPKYYRFVFNRNVAASFGWNTQRLENELGDKLK